MAQSAVRFTSRRRPLAVIGKVLAYLVIVVFSLVVAYPLIAVLFDSFKTSVQFFNDPWGLPTSLDFSNYQYAWNVAHIPRFMLNSAIVAGATILLTLVCASTAAYSFSSFRFVGNRSLFIMFVLLLIVPAPVGIIPLYVIVTRLHLINTYFALILPYTSGALPLSIFILRTFFDSIPRDLSDAARIDGCTHLRAFLSVILPIAKPGLATVTILTFLSAWNEFFLALIFIHDPNLMTLPLGLQSFFYQYFTQWPYVFASLCLANIPVIVVYVLLQRQFISGLTAGALKA
jgi:raffinose/stachyose/melibiose transport system permease protein